MELFPIHQHFNYLLDSWVLHLTRQKGLRFKTHLKHILIMSEQELYKLTIQQLAKLCRDFQADCFDGFVSNDKSYIEHWLKNETNNNTRKRSREVHPKD